MEEKPFIREELIADLPMTPIGWITANYMDFGKVAGSFANLGEGPLQAADYGTGTGWHGPALKRSLSVPIQNFRVEVDLDFQMTSYEIGRMEVYLLDEASEIIGEIAIWRNQFIRLIESGVVRLYVGYHRRSDGDVQPTIVLGEDNTLSGVLGALQVTQMRAGFSDASTNIGLVDEVINGVTYKSVFLEMQRSGISVLHANDFQVLYSGNGKWHFRRDKTSSYSSSLTIADNGSDTDFVMPNVTMRNSRVTGYTGVVQFLTPNIVGDGWGGVQAHIIAPSLREYKSNIRDVPFSALEKVRNAKVREFNYKGDVNLLYEMRENKDPNDPPLTTKDIKQYYGLIVDESDEVFVDKDKTGTHLYSMTSLTMRAVQELEEKHDQDMAILKGQLEAKDTEVAAMNNRIASLEALVQSLIDKGSQTETEIRYRKNGEKKKIIPDVKYRDEEGILHAVEVDRSQKMKINEEKLKKYEEFTQIYKQKYNGKVSIIHFFTVTKYREKKLEQLAAKYDIYVIQSI